mgnify:CR=1 FL=1
MSAKLPDPPLEYERRHLSEIQNLLEETNSYSLKLNEDNIVEDGSVILKSIGGNYFKLAVSDAGALSAVSVTVDSDGRPVTSGNPYV